MNNKQLAIIRILALTLLLGLISCSETVPPDSGQQKDNPVPMEQGADSTQTEVPGEVAKRVVALTSLSADILDRLDSSLLVGVPGSSLIKSDERFSELPTVSEGRTPPNLELILQLKPDLVIGASGFHDQLLTRMEELGIPAIATEVTKWEDLTVLTEKLAELTGTDAEPLLKQYASLLPEETPADSKPSTLVLVSQKPILAPSKSSWAGDLLAKFHANNLVADAQGSSEFRGYISLSPELILAQDPDILILINDPDGATEKLKAQPFWKELKAVKGDRVYTFEYYGLVNPGSIGKVTEATKKLTTVLN